MNNKSEPKKKKRQAKIESWEQSQGPSTQGRDLDPTLLRYVDDLILEIIAKTTSKETNEFRNRCMKYQEKRQEIENKWLELNSNTPASSPDPMEELTSWFKKALGTEQLPEKMDKEQLLTELQNLASKLSSLKKELATFLQAKEADADVSESQSSESNSESFFDTVITHAENIYNNLFPDQSMDETYSEETQLTDSDDLLEFPGDLESHSSSSTDEIERPVLRVTAEVKNMLEDEEIQDLYAEIQEDIGAIAVIKYEVSKIEVPLFDKFQKLDSMKELLLKLKLNEINGELNQINDEIKDTDALVVKFNSFDYPSEMQRNKLLEHKQVIKKQLDEQQKKFEEAHTKLNALLQAIKLLLTQLPKTIEVKPPIFVERIVTEEDMYPNGRPSEKNNEKSDTDSDVSDQIDNPVNYQEDPVDVIETPVTTEVQNSEDNSLSSSENDHENTDMPEAEVIVEQEVIPENKNNDDNQDLSDIDDTVSATGKVHNNDLTPEDDTSAPGSYNDEFFEHCVFEHVQDKPPEQNNDLVVQNEPSIAPVLPGPVNLPIQSNQSKKPYSKSDLAALIFTLGLMAMIMYAEEHYQRNDPDEKLTESQHAALAFGCAFVNACFAFLPGIIAGITMSIKTGFFGLFDKSAYTGAGAPKEETLQPDESSEGLDY